MVHTGDLDVMPHTGKSAKLKNQNISIFVVKLHSSRKLRISVLEVSKSFPYHTKIVHIVWCVFALREKVRIMDK